MPVTEALSEPWYETPNIHLCTVKDFIALTQACDVAIEEALVLNDRQHRATLDTPRLANLFGEKAIFRLRKD
jgi:methionine biosynthesis protein MetW